MIIDDIVDIDIVKLLEEEKKARMDGNDNKCCELVVNIV
jgi:hypothetical protein